MDNKTQKHSQFPQHFWQIHKKVYNREWQHLDRGYRQDILNDLEGKAAQGFFAHVQRLAISFFNDENHNYNARHRFQYCP